MTGHDSARLGAGTVAQPVHPDVSQWRRQQRLRWRLRRHEHQLVALIFQLAPPALAHSAVDSEQSLVPISAAVDSEQSLHEQQLVHQ